MLYYIYWINTIQLFPNKQIDVGKTH